MQGQCLIELLVLNVMLWLCHPALAPPSSISIHVRLNETIHVHRACHSAASGAIRAPGMQWLECDNHLGSGYWLPDRGHCAADQPTNLQHPHHQCQGHAGKQHSSW